MKNIIFVLIIALAGACSGSKSTVKETETPAAQQTITKDSIFLSLERTICFGECPAYKITIYPDKTVKYEGYKFVERTGTHFAMVSDELVKEIRGQADKIGFFQMKDKYDASVSDVPSTITIISGPNGIKRVINRFEGPAELRSFEKYLDTVLLNLDWKAEKQ